MIFLLTSNIDAANSSSLADPQWEGTVGHGRCIICQLKPTYYDPRAVAIPSSTTLQGPTDLTWVGHHWNQEVNIIVEQTPYLWIDHHKLDFVGRIHQGLEILPMTTTDTESGRPATRVGSGKSRFERFIYGLSRRKVSQEFSQFCLDCSYNSVVVSGERFNLPEFLNRHCPPTGAKGNHLPQVGVH